MQSASPVVVVDDDRDLRDTLSAVLQSAGYRVRCVGNGAEALALMHDVRPAAIVLDLSMPVMSGWDLLAAVREDSDFGAVPVLVLSAMRAPAGVAHLGKPATVDDLLTTLGRMCSP
jgi:CheY-like chemotaxis protein